ncbi:MAG: hypothetical protein Kow0068_19990 [Marinilabiliales bacterium]
MINLFLSKSERDIIVFHIWKSLNYNVRIALSILLLVSGFVTQVILFSLFPGIVLVFAGILLVLVKGYNNKVDFGKFSADSEWEKTDIKYVKNIDDITRKMKKWDKNPFDITNTLGFFVFILIIIGSIILINILSNYYSNYSAMWIIIANIITIVVPFWMTGTTKISLLPKLIVKSKLLQDIYDNYSKLIKPHQIEFYIQLAGKEKRIPKDLKIKVNFENQPENFLGVYGQVSINSVNGNNYPYFYCVIVTYKDFGLKEFFNKITSPKGIIKKYKLQNDVEIIVIRQYTTKTSGYYTNEKTVNKIFNFTIKIAKEIIDIYNKKNQ